MWYEVTPICAAHVCCSSYVYRSVIRHIQVTGHEMYVWCCDTCIGRCHIYVNGKDLNCVGRSLLLCMLRNDVTFGLERQVKFRHINLLNNLLTRCKKVSRNKAEVKIIICYNSIWAHHVYAPRFVQNTVQLFTHKLKEKLRPSNLNLWPSRTYCTFELIKLRVLLKYVGHIYVICMWYVWDMYFAPRCLRGRSCTLLVAAFR